jgi:hypothetical protein
MISLVALATLIAVVAMADFLKQPFAARSMLAPIAQTHQAAVNIPFSFFSVIFLPRFPRQLNCQLVGGSSRSCVGGGPSVLLRIAVWVTQLPHWGINKSFIAVSARPPKNPHLATLQHPPNSRHHTHPPLDRIQEQTSLCRVNRPKKGDKKRKETVNQRNRKLPSLPSPFAYFTADQTPVIASAPSSNTFQHSPALFVSHPHLTSLRFHFWLPVVPGPWIYVRRPEF